MLQTLDGSYSPLARLNIQNLNTFNGIDFVYFPKNCFGNNVPDQDLYMSSPHQIVDNFVCCPAMWYIGKLEGVKIVEKSGAYYNLLFDKPEYLNIHGVCVTSHHPNHPSSPLKLEEYINILLD